MSGDEEAATSRTPSNANIDQRVARVESDLGRLSASFDGFRTLIDERFHTFGETLRRIESAVTAPTAADAATVVSLADMTRRMAAQEATTAALSAENTALRNELTGTKAQLATVAATVRFVGFGGFVILFVALVGWVLTNGGVP